MTLKIRDVHLATCLYCYFEVNASILLATSVNVKIDGTATVHR